ncbi:hypothetical protein [Terracidiphilus sp.]|jgi:hypothetical protein|uniref:hypothetical protein n=1 Tax=Terracidiphilus sp. TaxID=1964191 RepID=UPI003C158A50
MSNCRTFNRSSRREQKKPRGAAMINVSNLAYQKIAEDPERFVNKLFYMVEEKDSVNAASLIIKLADGAEIVAVEEAELDRPTLIERWTVELENEAEAAQEAATRELGQIPEPETAVEALAEPVAVKAAAASTAQPEPAGAHSNIGSTHINEIGLPVVNQSQTMNSPGTRSCRSTPRPSAPSHESKQAAVNQSGASIYV